VHYWADGACGRFVVDGPIVMGHETSGTVVQVGSHVTNLKLGEFFAYMLPSLGDIIVIVNGSTLKNDNANVYFGHLLTCARSSPMGNEEIISYRGHHFPQLGFCNDELSLKFFSSISSDDQNHL
jgi:hypothetical protein